MHLRWKLLFNTVFCICSTFIGLLGAEIDSFGQNMKNTDKKDPLQNLTSLKSKDFIKEHYEND